MVLLIGLIGFLPVSALHSAKENAEAIRLVTDPETGTLMEEIGNPLLEAADLSPERIHFHVMVDSAMNAFALPNGHIVFHSGLILAAQDVDELSAVMAHEIAHLSSGHHIQLEGDAKRLGLQALIATAAGLVAGIAAKDGKITEAALVGGAAATRSGLIAAIRDKERQADNMAVHLLSKAGRSPKGLVRFLERISREQRLMSMPPPYLLTHPVGPERIQETRELVAEAPAPTRPFSATSLRRLGRVQARLEAITATNPAQAADQFRQRAEQHPNDPGARQAALFGLAASLRYAGQLPEAEALLNKLLEEDPKDPYLLRDRAVLRLEKGSLSAAEADLRLALQTLPDHPDLKYQLAFVLNERKESEQAVKLLRQLTSAHPELAEPFYLLGLAEGNRGQKGAGHLAMGRYYRMQLREDMAKWHLKEALKEFPPGAAEREIVRQELDYLEKQLKEGKGSLSRR
ncbi:MAG: M48 family metalloprotease [Magnetococcales bacterium]|nr:M48 family metalloprotease [Magnetococcales bacterium]